VNWASYIQNLEKLVGNSWQHSWSLENLVVNSPKCLSYLENGTHSYFAVGCASSVDEYEEKKAIFELQQRKEGVSEESEEQHLIEKEEVSSHKPSCRAEHLPSSTSSLLTRRQSTPHI